MAEAFRKIANSSKRRLGSEDRRLALNLSESIPFLIRDAHRHLVRALDEELEKKSLSRGTWYCLRVLWEEEGLSQSELAARIGVMTPTTTAGLSNLERAGLIERRPDAKDKRKHLIFLTSAGRALELQLLPVAHQVLARALSDITEVEADTLRKVLRKIRNNTAPRGIG
jgi:DNA-binding MarR family transcriptional regulator